MADQDAPLEIDRRKIRIGLGMITVVVIAALLGVALIDSAAGKAVMFAIALLAFVRAFLLSRSLRAERR